MAIHWSLDRLEKILPTDLFLKLSTISCNPSIPMNAGGHYPIIHGETGNLITGVPYEKGLRVPRSQMRALCAEGIEVQVSYLNHTPCLALLSGLTKLILLLQISMAKISLISLLISQATEF